MQKVRTRFLRLVMSAVLLAGIGCSAQAPKSTDVIAQGVGLGADIVTGDPVSIALRALLIPDLLHWLFGSHEPAEQSAETTNVKQ